MSIDKNKVFFLREENGDGQGTFTYSDGNKYEGEWKNGKRCNGTEYNKYGKMIGKYVKGKYKTNKPQKPTNLKIRG